MSSPSDIFSLSMSEVDARSFANRRSRRAVSSLAALDCCVRLSTRTLTWTTFCFSARRAFEATLWSRRATTIEDSSSMTRFVDRSASISSFPSEFLSASHCLCFSLSCS